jgi:hypothetical protein
MTQATGQPQFEIRYAGVHRERPPLANLLFDVTLRNQAAGARWFLLPAKIEPSTGPGGGVDGIEVDAMEGKGRVVLGRFQGRQKLQALLLPAGAEIAIRRLAIQTWEDLPKGAIPIVAVAATNLTVGGEPAESWFGENPSCDLRAEVSADDAEMISARHTPERNEVPLSFTEEARFRALVNLSNGQFEGSSPGP